MNRRRAVNVRLSIGKLSRMNDFIRRNMWDNANRPEQMFAIKHLKTIFPDHDIKSEFVVRNLLIDGKPYKRCIIDVAIPKKKIAIRFNGGYHHVSSRQQNKDNFQKIALEQAGWLVLDFNSFLMPNLFKRKKNEQVRTEAILEIEKMVLNIG